MNKSSAIAGITAALICGCGIAQLRAADTADGTTWATGVVLRAKLADPVDVLWSGNPLRDALGDLSKAQRVAILIDRRVDPGQKLDLVIKSQSMETALTMIANHCGLGVSRLGDVVYLGPPTAAERLAPTAAALRRAVRQLPQPAQQRLMDVRPMAWQDLAAPRELILQLGSQSGVEIAHENQIPHDLWTAADLPPLALVDRLTLIAVQFDLTFKVVAGGRRLELVVIPGHLPAATDDFQPLPMLAPSTRQPAAAVDDVRIKRLVIQNKPLGPVLQQLALRLGLELRMDEKAIKAAGISLDRRVTVSVENATVDELLRKLVNQASLTFRRHGRIVEISSQK